MHLLLLLFLFGGISHDIQVAFYKIYQEDNVVFVQFEFEKEDIIEELRLAGTEWSDDNLHEYIDGHFSCIVNGIHQHLKVDHLQINQKHISITARLADVNAKVSQIGIYNTCLSSIEGHSNIIQIQLNGQERDFLMNSDRTNIQINY